MQPVLAKVWAYCSLFGAGEPESHRFEAFLTSLFDSAILTAGMEGGWIEYASSQASLGELPLTRWTTKILEIWSTGNGLRKRK
jgi:hypothetical protein